MCWSGLQYLDLEWAILAFHSTGPNSWEQFSRFLCPILPCLRPPLVPFIICFSSFASNVFSWFSIHMNGCRVTSSGYIEVISRYICMMSLSAIICMEVPGLAVICWIPAQRPFKFWIHPGYVTQKCDICALPVARNGTDEGEDEGSVNKHCKSLIGFEGQ